MAILGIDHVGIAVRGDGSAAETFARLLETPQPGFAAVAAQPVRICFLPAAPPNLELLAPSEEDSPVARFLERRGEGLHHVCFAVDDITAELARLVGAGFEAIDAAPRRGHGGLVAFLHPRSAHGVLVELLQRDPPQEGRT